MIMDAFANYSSYPFGSFWEKAFEWLKTLDSASLEGKTFLLEKKLYGNIFTFYPKTRAEGVLESHQRYVDLHVLLQGQEKMEWELNSRLSSLGAYNQEKDVIFYEKKEFLSGEFLLQPGFFVVFFPHDAHLTQLHTACAVPVPYKKVVVKMDQELLSLSHEEIRKFK